MIKSLDLKACEMLLSNNYIGHLAYIHHNKPFVVPITYFYKNNKIICYSDEGHKIDALRKHNTVALEVAEISGIDHWQSAVAHGLFEEVRGSEAKALLHDFSLGIKELILKKELKQLDFINQFSAKLASGKIPIVFVIHVQELTGKMRR